MTEDAAVPRIDNQNIARDHAHVDQQIGVLEYGEFVFHYGDTYAVSPNDTAERRHEVAINNLDGGVPRRAEEQFGQLIFAGDPTTQRVYYYVLSVLSDRSSRDLAGELVTRIHEAVKLGIHQPVDSWTQALWVVWSLLEHLRSDSDEDSLTAVTAFGRLHADRQDEISRHLALLLNGVIEQQLDATRQREVAVGRIAGNRVGRAWKYFEPDPDRPTRYELSVVYPRATYESLAVFGFLVALLAFIGLFFSPPTLALWSGLLLLPASCWITLRPGIERAAHRLYLQLRRDATRFDDGESIGPTPADKFIKRSFREARPEYAQDWTQYAGGYQARLQQRFAVQLRDDDLVAAKRLRWLFDWHARRIAQQWPHHDSYVRPAPQLPAAWSQAVGVVAAVAGLVLLVVAHHWPVAPLVVGGVLTLPVLMEFSARRRAVVLLGEEADALHNDEMAEYDRWLGELADRPHDSEMARWLALDKAHLRAVALQRGNIAEQELVSHVVITELAPGARRGAMPYGPPRYEAYLVTVILLTRRGVRHSRVYLDFNTGKFKNELWHVFGYDRIASASMDMKETTGKSDSGDSVTKMRREFRLRLVDGVEIMKINDSPPHENDADVGDEAELDRLAATTSGVDAALPVLEAVAHRGREWIDFQSEHWKLRLPAWPD